MKSVLLVDFLDFQTKFLPVCLVLSMWTEYEAGVSLLGLFIWGSFFLQINFMEKGTLTKGLKFVYSTFSFKILLKHCIPYLFQNLSAATGGPKLQPHCNNNIDKI